LRLPHIFALALCAAGTAPAAVADDRAADAPKALDEGLARLEKLLGRQSEKDFRQWRFVIDDETRLTPDPGKSVVIVAKGVMTYGVPVRSGGIITFDEILSTHRSLFHVGDGEKRTLSRGVENHTAVRYTLHQASSGDWFFDAVSLSHNIPQFRDRPSETGRVNWLADGIELVGMGTDEFLRQGSKLAPCAFVMRRKLTRNGDRLTESLRSKTYEFARSPERDVLPIPDFSRPFGDEFKTERKSEPLKRD
jgi:hypothetical protein